MSKIRSSSSHRGGLNIGLTLFAGVFLLALIAVMTLFGLYLVGFFENGQAAGVPPLDTKISPEEVAAWRVNEETRLNSYGWVDKDASVVRIPISQAMVLVAESGLPVGEPTATPTPMPAPTATAAPTVAVEAETPGEEIPAPEPSPTPAAAPTVDLANVSFQNHVLPIFEEHCTECHGGDEPEEGLRLTSHAEVMAGSWNGSVIEPGDVENSYLIEQVVTGRMPKRGPKLSPAEIEIIIAWVEAGALDN